MSTLLLVLFAAGVVRVVVLLVSPTRKGTSKADQASGLRYPRRGAVTVHRWRRLLLEELRERRQRQ